MGTLGHQEEERHQEFRFSVVPRCNAMEKKRRRPA